MFIVYTSGSTREVSIVRTVIKSSHMKFGIVDGDGGDGWCLDGESLSRSTPYT